MAHAIVNMVGHNNLTLGVAIPSSPPESQSSIIGEGVYCCTRFRTRSAGTGHSNSHEHNKSQKGESISECHFMYALSEMLVSSDSRSVSAKVAEDDVGSLLLR